MVWARRLGKWCAILWIPHTKIGMVGGAGMLGLGRALGETMAVTFVIGNAHGLNLSLFAPGSQYCVNVGNRV